MQTAVSNAWPPRARLLAACAVAALACLRFAHIHLLWADENYHLAASMFLLHGKVPYRDFWYDKPPLDALYYLICGGYAGWPLRILDAGYIVAACALIWRFARAWWGEAEAWAAALFLAFFTAFYLPSGIIPFSPDALTMLPELAAVYCAYRRRAFWAGAWAAIAFLANPKALFVLAICAVWLFPELPLLAAGFVIPVAIGFGWLAGAGAWSGYVEQVWHWGFIYARNSPQPHPFETGVKTTLDWLGFQAALAVAAIYGFPRLKRDARWRLGVWLVFSFAAVCLGLRFAPHYYLQFLPALVFVAARGTVLALREHKRPALAILVLLLLVPLVRFGPRYVLLTLDNIHHREPRWNDVILDLDSRQVAEKIRALGHPGDTLFVWGYRPSMYVYTRMVPPGLFWDSQPLTGVPADRHLHATSAVYGGAAAHNRKLLIRTHPTFIVDGLGLLNPRLKPSVYSKLRPWLAQYRLVGRTKLSLIYRER